MANNPATDVYKPTPTQDENDRAALGEHIMNHEPDGSPVEQSPAEQVKAAQERRKKDMTAEHSGGGYQTRQTRATTHETK